MNEIEGKYYVYFFYDINDNLLYIGLTGDIYRRFLNHMNNKHWANQVVNVGYRIYSNAKTMRLAEAYYISKLKPKYNVTLNDREELGINMNDTSQEIIMNKESFILKHNNIKNKDQKNKVSHKKRATKNNKIKERFINDGWDIIEKSCVDIFDKNIMCLDLNKTVFIFENNFIYFSGHPSLKNDGGVNTTVKKLKYLLTSNVKGHKDDPKHCLLNMTSRNDKGFSSFSLIESIKGIDNYIEEVNVFKNKYISLTDNKFIIDFSIFSIKKER